MFELYRDDSELAPKFGSEFSLCNPLEILEDVRSDFWILTDGNDLMCCRLMLLQHGLLGHYLLLLGRMNVLLLFNISWFVIWSWLLCWIDGEIRCPCLYLKILLVMQSVWILEALARVGGVDLASLSGLGRRRTPQGRASSDHPPPSPTQNTCLLLLFSKASTCELSGMNSLYQTAWSLFMKELTFQFWLFFSFDFSLTF